MTWRNSMAPRSGQLGGGWYVSPLRSSGLTVASKLINLAIEPSEVSSIVQPDTRDERAPLKAANL